jgi:CubicO group peptidase (beta-lactamase class C family)
MHHPLLTETAPGPIHGWYAPGYETLARTFARQIAHGEEAGAAITVYRAGQCVADMWGGVADMATGRPWEQNTRIVLFSVTKSLAAMAFLLLADRGLLDYDAPVARYWPGFGRNGKADITVRTLLNHRAGLAAIDKPIRLDDCIDPASAAMVLEAIEVQRPLWTPGENQGYHALTYGLYAAELFYRVSGERLHEFIRREVLRPIDSDVWLGTPAELDPLMATLYPPEVVPRVARMVASAAFAPSSAEGRIARDIPKKTSFSRRAFQNPSTGRESVAAYNTVRVRRAALAWGSATGSAHGVARMFLPFSQGGSHDSIRFVAPETLRPVYARQGWSASDSVLQKPIGWSQGFMKEERHLFSPNPESFGHSGMGGSLGWCDPVDQIAFGYTINRMDWRVRSPRCVELCHALYESDAMLKGRKLP